MPWRLAISILNIFDRNSINYLDREDQVGYAAVINTLSELMENGERVALEVSGTRTQFQCRVVAMDAIHGEFVIDELNPRLPDKLLTRDRAMRLTVPGEFSDSVVQSQYIEPLIENCNSSHQLGIPTELIDIPRKQDSDVILRELN